MDDRTVVRPMCGRSSARNPEAILPMTLRQSNPSSYLHAPVAHPDDLLGAALGLDSKRFHPVSVTEGVRTFAKKRDPGRS